MLHPTPKPNEVELDWRFVHSWRDGTAHDRLWRFYGFATPRNAKDFLEARAPNSNLFEFRAVYNNGTAPPDMKTTMTCPICHGKLNAALRSTKKNEEKLTQCHVWCAHPQQCIAGCSLCHGGEADTFDGAIAKLAKNCRMAQKKVMVEQPLAL